MRIPDTRNYKKPMQYIICVGLVLLVAGAFFFAANFIGYRVIALLLLVTVSLLAMLFDFLPVLLAALISALIWNFFFIPPLFTFHIDNAEDILMFLMYFLIALVNAVLTIKIRDVEKKARDKEEKEHTIKLYNTLLNSLSHELRTPVATIIGAVDTLKENKDRLTVSQQNELLSQVDIASIRLNQQVENLLNMSRLESGMLKLNLDWCDINELIFSVLQKLSISESHHIIDFQHNDRLPLFKLDAGLIEQVLHNIISNALQYTPDHSTIKISVKHSSENCVITIEDNGNGFPASEIQYAFDKFYRLPKTKAGGTGLGLSIVKGFIEAHKGSISLENNINGGAKFTITIPAATSFINNLKQDS